MTTKPFLWDADLLEMRRRVLLTSSRGLILGLARHLVLVHRRSAGLLRSFRKLA